MISSGQWTYVLIKMLINSNSHKENQIIQQLTTLILCNLSFLLFQTIQYAQFFCLKPWRIPINSYFQVLCAVIARYTTAVSYYHTGSSCPNHILLIMSTINRIFCSRQTKLFCHLRTKIIAAERRVFV